MEVDSSGLVTPTARFVLKTRQGDGMKVFINVCDHPLVPASHIVTSTEFARIGHDKDGTDSGVYDVCFSESRLKPFTDSNGVLNDSLLQEV